MSANKDSKRLTSLRAQADLLARSRLALLAEQHQLGQQLADVEEALEALVRECLRLARGAQNVTSHTKKREHYVGHDAAL